MTLKHPLYILFTVIFTVEATAQVPHTWQQDSLLLQGTWQQTDEDYKLQISGRDIIEYFENHTPMTCRYTLMNQSCDEGSTKPGTFLFRYYPGGGTWCFEVEALTQNKLVLWRSAIGYRRTFKKVDVPADTITPGRTRQQDSVMLQGSWIDEDGYQLTFTGPGITAHYKGALVNTYAFGLQDTSCSTDYSNPGKRFITQVNYQGTWCYELVSMDKETLVLFRPELDEPMRFKKVVKK